MGQISPCRAARQTKAERLFHRSRKICGLPPVNGCPTRSPDPAQRRSVPRLSQRHAPRFSGGKENRSKISLTPDGEGKAKIELLKLQTQIETPQKPPFRPAALLRRSWPQARNCKGAAEPKSQPSANGCDLEGRNRGCARSDFQKKSEQAISLLRLGGGGWIRTTEAKRNRFTVCPLWPLGNSSI